MDKKFKHGDRVYHKNLKQYGFFIGYAWESEEECDVNFETEDGEMEQKHVSVSWLELAQKTYNKKVMEAFTTQRVRTWRCITRWRYYEYVETGCV